MPNNNDGNTKNSLVQKNQFLASGSQTPSDPLLPFDVPHPALHRRWRVGCQTDSDFSRTHFEEEWKQPPSSSLLQCPPFLLTAVGEADREVTSMLLLVDLEASNTHKAEWILPSRGLSSTPLISLMLTPTIFSFFKIYLFQREQGGGAEGERILSRLRAECRAQHRAQSHTPWFQDLSQNQVLDAQPTMSPRCPTTMFSASCPQSPPHWKFPP